MSIRSIIRSFNWRDDVTLYSHDIAYNKDAFDLQHAYGIVLARQGDYTHAKTHFEASIALAPKWWVSYADLATLYYKEHNYVAASKLFKK